MHGTCMGVGVSAAAFQNVQHLLCQGRAGQCLGGPYGAGHAAKEGLVPLRQLKKDELASDNGSSIVPPHRQRRNLSKIRHDSGGGDLKFRGSVKKTKQL